MKKSSLYAMFAIFGLMLALVMAFGAFAPAQAAPILAQAQTPAPGDPGPAVTVVVPQTGGDSTPNDGFFLSGWTLLIILGVVIVVLLIALVARGSDRTV